MATHSSVLAWRMPWTEESGGLQSMGLQRVRHDWVTAHTHTEQSCSIFRKLNVYMTIYIYNFRHILPALFTVVVLYSRCLSHWCVQGVPYIFSSFCKSQTKYLNVSTLCLFEPNINQSFISISHCEFWIKTLNVQKTYLSEAAKITLTNMSEGESGLT